MKLHELLALFLKVLGWHGTDLSSNGKTAMCCGSWAPPSSTERQDKEFPLHNLHELQQIPQLLWRSPFLETAINIMWNASFWTEAAWPPSLRAAATRYHLPVAIPWAPPCADTQTNEGWIPSCTWSDRTSVWSCPDSDCTQVQGKYSLSSQEKLSCWADGRQRLQLVFFRSMWWTQCAVSPHACEKNGKGMENLSKQ